VADLLAGDDVVLQMPEIGIEIHSSEIYRRVEFEVGNGDGLSSSEEI
jgi:hypothetical protein